MSRKLIFIVVVFSLVQSTLALAVNAQNCTGYWTAGYPIAPPAAAFNCEVPGPFLLSCVLMNIFCSPPPECVDCRNPTGSKPINLVTGNTDITQKDVSIPGLGGGLTLVRTWHSMWPVNESAYQVGLFGPNWRSSYEERVFVGNDNYMKYSKGDGNFWSFGYASGTWIPVSPANVSATLTQGTSYWTLTFQNGEQRHFDINSGSLIAIIDRNGNTTSLTYDATNRLTTVTDPASRYLTFSYGSNTSRLVTGVTSSVGLGLSLTYAYDAQNRLSQVTFPDSTTVSFTYNSQSLITAVTDSNNKTLESHTYDSNGRGLTGSQANGVNAVTVTYH